MLKKILRLSHEIIDHPLKKNRMIALIKFFIWNSLNKIGMHFTVTVKYVNNSKLIVDGSMNQAQKNIYLGITEFNPISFVLHYLREGDCFVDVGANVGEFTIAALSTGADCISFEAMPDTFNNLKRNVLINNLTNIEMHNIGIGKEKGDAIFITSVPDTQRRQLSPDELLNNSTTRSIRIPMNTLNNIIGDRKVSILKIDVEGYEENVIEGSDRIFQLNPPEVVMLEIWDNNPDCRLRKMMTSYGYVEYSYEAYSRSLVHKIDQNVIYVKNIEGVMNRIKDSCGFLINGNLI